jgi:transposase
VDERKSSTVRPQQVTLPERPDGWGMVARGPADPCGSAWRQPPPFGRARTRRRVDVYFEHRLSVAGNPQGFAGAFDALRLFRPVELRRHAWAHSRNALWKVSRASRTRGQPDRRDHRQPERQVGGKRGLCIDPHGYDAGKKIKGKKRHILVDTQGLLIHAIVHGADIQDRDGGVLLMATLFGAFPFLLRLYADGGYQGPQFQAAMKQTVANVNVEIVKRSDGAKGFAVLPKRWIVERTFAWLNRCRRLAKDWECLTQKALAFLHLASIRLMLRKLCNPRK